VRSAAYGLGATLITAPAIVHAGNIMRVKPFVLDATRVMDLLVYDIEEQAFVPLGRVGRPDKSLYIGFINDTFGRFG
jgi:hypothetical protein